MGRNMDFETGSRFDAQELQAWAQVLLVESGLSMECSETVAAILLEGDLLGHDTHGLALLSPYLNELRSGGLRTDSDIAILSQRPASALWDGNRLPGPWLTCKAIEAAGNAARQLGTSMITIKSAGHIGCLASYLEAPARDGLMVEILCSDPSVCSVAPFGGKRAVFTPNPMAFGIPSGGDPILIDISSSITTNGMSARLAAEGEAFPGPWLLDGDGVPTADPSVFAAEPPGTIQLLGGPGNGHKGYGLALLVEAMTGGLAGYGRADNVAGWGATVMVRVTDCAAFGGLQAFHRQIDWLIRACKDCPPIEPQRPVRLPGHNGLARKRDALANGLVLHPKVLNSLEEVASNMKNPLPTPV